MLLLCSDGLHGVLDDALDARSCWQRRARRAGGRATVVAALDRNASDNVTALVVRSDGTDRQARNRWSAARSHRPFGRAIARSR